MSPGKRVVVLVLLVVSCLIAYTSRPLTAFAAAGINSQISFTGKLVKSDNTNITDGTYNMEFKVYQNGTNAGVGSTLLWTEDYLVAGSTGMPSTGGVTLSSGTFSINLASICAFAGGTCGAKTNTAIDFNQDTLWVSVQIGNSTSCTVTSVVTSFNTACGGDGEMSPYIRLTAVPYAANAALLSGIAVTSLGQLASNQTWTGNNIFKSSASFQVQNTASTAILTVDTTNSLTILNGNLNFATGADRTLSVATPSTNVAGNNLTIAAAAGGAGATGVAGGNLTLVNGNAAGTTGTAAGGSTIIKLGAGINGGAAGVFNIQDSSGNNFLQFDTIGVAMPHSTTSYGTLTCGMFFSNGCTIKAATLDLMSSGSTNALNILPGSGGAIVIPSSNTTTAFQVQNATGTASVLTADTTNGLVALGSSSAGGVNGTLGFLNSTNTNNVQLVSGATTTSYSLTLPLAAPSSGQCLTASTTTQLAFASCGGGGSTLQGAYDSSNRTSDNHHQCQ